MNDLLKKLNSKKITIDLIDNQLAIKAPKGAMTSELLSMIKENKQSLISFISEYKPDNALDIVIPKASKKSNYVLSSSQYRLWLIEQIENNSAYNMPSLFSLKGTINILDLEKAFFKLIERHEILRTNIIIEQDTGIPKQYILSVNDCYFKLNYIDVSKEEDISKTLLRIKEKELGYNFNLESESLIRVTLIKKSDDEYLLISVMHHIISDGWSSSVMITDLFSIYQSIIKGEQFPLEPLSLQYKDFAEWQQSTLNSDAIKKDKNYWLNQFKKEVPILEIPADKLRPSIKTYNGGTIESFFDRDLIQAYKKVCKDQGVTLFMGLLSIVKILLHKYTNQSDIVIGIPFSGREHSELQNQIGYYVNTIALRTKFEKTDTFVDFLQKVKQNTLKANEHQNYPFDELIKDLNLKTDRSRNPLFDVLLTFDTNETSNKNKTSIEGLSIKEISLNDDTSKFDLDFAFKEKEDDFNLILTYNSDIYNEKFILGISNHLETILHSVISMSQAKIDSIKYISKIERKQLLEEFNNTKVDCPKDKTIVDLFEEQVKKTPNSIAVVFEDNKLTYQALNEMANQLGSYLQKQYTIQPDDLIAIKLDRSEYLLVAILGILKTGSAYVPIDTNYPQQRIEYIEKDSNAKVVIDSSFLEQFEKSKVNYSKENRLYKVTTEHLAYVIYTSGTTGNPKGVMIEHKSMLNQILWYTNTFNINGETNSLLLTSYTFDPSTQDIFGTLIRGGRLHVIGSDKINDLDFLYKFIKEKQITILNYIPNFIDNLLSKRPKIASINSIIVGGEALSLHIKNNLIDKEYKLYNNYGPTETTVDVLSGLMSEKNVHIGRPISNTQAYILNDNLELLPIGVTGKLYISGDGLARGYLNRPELTKEKFIGNPFIEAERMYDTGDLSKWLPDGNIEFLGRKDQQIKLRGYRIELGEIENSILSYSKNINQAVVLVKDETLVVYYTQKDSIDETALKRYLKERLPSYMIPNHLKVLESIPLTPNGKIDRKQLRGLHIDYSANSNYVAPIHETEQKLVEIWQEVLGIEKIGIQDNFFELGGNSLMISQVINKIYKHLEGNVTFKEFFQDPIIEHIARAITKENYSPIPQVEKQAYYPLTPSQHRIWVLSQLEGGSQAYNMAGAVFLIGKLDIDKFKIAFHKLIARHEILRTCFKANEEGEIHQYIVDTANLDFDITLHNFEGKSKEEINSYIHKEQLLSFDLTKAPLLRVTLLQINKEEHLLFFTIHHIIGDGWSMELLTSEIVTTYNEFLTNEHYKNEELPLQYKDYAVWLQSQLTSVSYKDSEAYWLNKFQGELPILNLPSFKKRPLIQTYNGKTISHQFSKGFLLKLKQFSKSHDATLFITLMSGVNALLYHYTNQDDIIIGTPIAGREHPDLEQQIGLYLNTLAIRTQLKDDFGFEDLLQQQKKTLLEAYEHQIYPFDALVSRLDLKRDISRSALFDVMVVLQNQNEVTTISSNNQNLEGIQVKSYELERKTSQVDVSFAFAEENEGLHLEIEYNTDIYDDFLIARMFDHFESLLNQAIDNPKEKLLSIDYLTKEESKQIFEEFNNTKVDYPKDKTIVDLFEEQVERTPNDVAVVFEDKELTYQALNEMANQLASYLQKHYTIQPDDLIAVKLDRNEYLLVVILGILKTGSAYVPIDTSYPKQRIEYIEKDSNAKIVIDQSFLESFEKSSTEFNKLNVISIATPNNLAYVIYTSGTTGNPKGVMVTHKNVVSLIKPCNYFQFNKDTTLLSTGSISFDAVIFEYFGSLLNGSKLVLTNKEVLLDTEKLYSLIQTKEINSMWMTASWFEQVVDTRIDIFDKLRYLIVGGDVVSSPHVLRVYDVAPEIMIINGYGPTENTTFSTTYPIENRPYKNIPIGTPLSNSQALILNDSNVILSIGVTGELCLSGDGLSLGYLNKPELTKELFVNHPYNQGELIYKTGDLARWLPDGNIEFLGRKDQQIKLRGYRIELGEIEHAITQYSTGIQHVYVLLKNVINEKVLAVYYTAHKAIDHLQLKSFLQEKLPAYMVPSYYIKLDEIKLTTNHKADKKVFPEVTSKHLVRNIFAPPTNEIEKSLVNIWEEILLVNPIGINDDFFELGGHSLHSLQVINKVNLELNYTLSFKDIFETSTIKELAQIIKNEENKLNVSYHIPKSNNTDSAYELSPSQNRLWITSQLGGSRSFNIPLVFDILGEFNPNDFESAIVALLSRHNALRTSFKKDSENEVKQYVASIDELNFQLYVDEVPKTKEEIREYLKYRVQGAFDLENGPLLRAGVYKINDQHHVVYLVIHHLVTDGWSMEITFQEIFGHYKSIVTKNKPMTLKPLDIQYTDYVDWLQKNMANITEKERPFWHKQFEKEIPLLQLPFERKNRPLKKTYIGSDFDVTLQKNETRILKDLSTKFGVTTYASLLSIFKILLYKYSNISDLSIGSPFSGRFNNQIEDQIGLYLNTLPIRTQFNKNQTFKEIITNEGKSLIDYYDNPFYQMDDLLKELDIKTHNGRAPIFDIMLVYQNQGTIDLFTEDDIPDNIKIEAWKDTDIDQAQYDITIAFFEVKDEMVFEVYYNSDVYEQQHLEVVIKDYIYLIKNIIHHYDTPIDAFFEATPYSFLTDTEIIYERAHDDNSITRKEKLDETLPQDPVLKRKLSDLLIASLGKELSFDEDYFEAGGSSLVAIELVENINQALHEEYSILDFYENASVNLFHNYIQRKKINPVEEKEDDFVINFTKHLTDESKPNLIIFPPLLGEGILFKGLSNKIEQELNVYAISMPIIDGSENVLQDLLTLFKERVKSLIVPGKVNYILGYSIGVNFAYEVAIHFEKEGFDIEMFLIDRGPISSSYKPTPKIIREMIDYNKPLIDSAKQMGIDENILHQRIEQTVKAFASYKLKEKTNVPIYSFESEAHMEKWKNYTSKFKGVQTLKGTHHEALTKENIETISQTIKNTIRISLHN